MKCRKIKSQGKDHGGGGGVGRVSEMLEIQVKAAGLSVPGHWKWKK